MCGIAGFYDEKVKNFQKIKKFTNQLIHRGPDEEGFFSNYKGLSLGMRRLSIIDLKNGNKNLGHSIRRIFSKTSDSAFSIVKIPQ